MTDTKKATKPKKNSTQETATPPAQKSGLAENTSFELVLPWEGLSTHYDQTIQHLASRLKLAGFRPGKIPTTIAEKHVDQEQLVSHVLRKAVPSVLEAKFVEAGDKYHPISQPSVQPISTLKGTDWKITVSFAEPPIIKLGDYKKIIKEAKKTGEEDLKNSKDKSESKDKTTNTPLTEEQKEEQKKEVYLRFIFRDLVEKVKPAIPELLVREETDYRLQNFTKSLQQFKIELQDYLKRRGVTAEQIIAEFQAESLASLQLEFILGEIGKEAKLEISDQERKQALAEIKDDKLQEQYKKDPHYQQRLENTLYRRKIVEHILSI